MKEIIINSLIVFGLGLLLPQNAKGQGTIPYLSNLAQPSAGNLAVGSDSWLATEFFTGNSVGGYILNSVQLGITDASGNPSGFAVMIYDLGGFGGPAPGNSLGTLNGSPNPATGGTYTYTPAIPLMLSSSTTYFIVLTAGSAVADGAYDWSYAGANSYNPGGGWSSRGGSFFISSDGSLWGPGSVVGPQYAITATPIPEPSVFSLLGFGALGFLWRSKKAKTVCSRY